MKTQESFKNKPYIDPKVLKNPIYHDIPPDDVIIIKRHFNRLKIKFGFDFDSITEEEATMILTMRKEKNVRTL